MEKYFFQKNVWRFGKKLVSLHPQCLKALPWEVRLAALNWECFRKPNAEPNLFACCRGEKRCTLVNWVRIPDCPATVNSIVALWHTSHCPIGRVGAGGWRKVRRPAFKGKNAESPRCKGWTRSKRILSVTAMPAGVQACVCVVRKYVYYYISFKIRGNPVVR